MKIDPDLLAARLERAVGPCVRRDPETLRSHTVEGKIPHVVCFPGSPEEISAALKVSAEAKASVIPWGGGTAMRLGNAPRAVDVVIALERLDQVLEHDAANLTVAVQAGMTVARLEEKLSIRGQFLPLDPPQPSKATIGGVVAANSNGPRRVLYGSVRDLVVGIRMVLASGTAIKAGGKVVKNVAGYDMAKLFIGSLGTLGIVTQVTFKVAPRPESEATVVAEGSLKLCLEFVEELGKTTLVPAAVTLLGARAIGSGSAASSPSVAVRAEGFMEATERHVRDLSALAERLRLKTRTLRDETHSSLWEKIRDFGSEDGVFYRVTVARGHVGAAIARIQSLLPSARMIAHAFSGTLELELDPHPRSVAWFPELTALAREHGGHAVLASAPPELKAGLEVWGPAPPGFSIMRRIKEEFDPGQMLNPGRFVGGL